ncbi:MAG: erythromycin esterase family protein [Phycisphaerales bacterium]
MKSKRLNWSRCKAANLGGSFLAWARRSAIPLPVSPEEPLGEHARAVLDRMLEGKRFAFLGEPEHFIVEKYPFRLMFIRHLYARGWRHVGMEIGRSVGWRVDRYVDTGDASFLQLDPPGATDLALHNRVLDFIDEHDGRFHEQLRRISELRGQNGPRLRYWGYDLDLGVPLGSIEPIRSLLRECGDSRIRAALQPVDELAGLSTDEQLARIEEMRRNLAACEEAPSELRSWLGFLHDSVAAENRPRMTQNLRGHRLWRAERERLMMQYLDEIVDTLSDGGRLILMGHNGHLSRDASNLHFHPQQSAFWGFHSWLPALGYEAFSRLTRCPMDAGMVDGSVGSHLHARFPSQVLSIWMLYGQGTLMTPAGPRKVRLHSDTIESLLAEVGDRFLLPLQDADTGAREILARANFRSSEGIYNSADLTVQADAVYFIRHVNAE